MARKQPNRHHPLPLAARVTGTRYVTAREFAYWLQGYFEIAKPTTADAQQLTMIQAHLNLVFVHEIDPSYGGPQEQAKLNAAHNGLALNSMETIQTYNEKAKANGQPLARC